MIVIGITLILFAAFFVALILKNFNSKSDKKGGE